MDERNQIMCPFPTAVVQACVRSGHTISSRPPPLPLLLRRALPILCLYHDHEEAPSQSRHPPLPHSPSGTITALHHAWCYTQYMMMMMMIHPSHPEEVGLPGPPPHRHYNHSRAAHPPETDCKRQSCITATGAETANAVSPAVSSRPRQSGACAWRTARTNAPPSRQWACR